MNYLEEFSRVEIALFELFREGGEFYSLTEIKTSYLNSLKKN